MHDLLAGFLLAVVRRGGSVEYESIAVIMYRELYKTVSIKTDRGLYQNEIKNSPKKRKTGSSTYVQDPVFVV